MYIQASDILCVCIGVAWFGFGDTRGSLEFAIVGHLWGQVLLWFLGNRSSILFCSIRFVPVHKLKWSLVWCIVGNNCIGWVVPWYAQGYGTLVAFHGVIRKESWFDVFKIFVSFILLSIELK